VVGLRQAKQPNLMVVSFQFKFAWAQFPNKLGSFP
jgi:hypothetical protein